ncbi:hypothetical protein [Crenobacter luteus]|uniref:Uncharacterized protein n=1 Tax=Crenobacter luteus TaxID=1452487 RepID=A0A163B9Q6_9NEIS|nr:hypothetical protein [Crenobacter luteus]KZE25314.1 hypothetical protein AVW16_03155 [Crenobacter luteus]
MNKTAAALWLAALASTAHADSGAHERAAGAEFLVSRDSDGFATHRASLEAFPRFDDAGHYAGVRIGEVGYRQHEWRRRGQRAGFVGRGRDPVDDSGWTLEAGVARQGGHTLATLDGGWRVQPARQTGIELFANRDWVETRAALDDGVHYTFAGVALDQGLGAHLTAVGVLGQQYFSDGNRRDHGRARLIYQPSLDLGLTVQARWRGYRSRSDDVGRRYFNPHDYQEAMLALGWRQRVAGWTGTLTAGLGRERIDDARAQATRLVEAGLQSPPRGPTVLRLNAGYQRNASFYGPDYSYRYVQGEAVLRF